MEADKANIEEGSFVLIASNVEDPDNAKLYVKGAEDFTFLTDMSGTQGMKGEKGEQGIQGKQGEKGATGDAGPANVLTIGTVSSGTTASATITGTSPSQKLNLVLPKGETGANGTNGKDGITPNISAMAEINDTTGTPSVSVAKTMAGDNPVFMFSFKNLKGERGANGTNATTTATATTKANGLMSSTDKTKLEGIATGATKNVVENVLTSTSTTNALSAAQGKALNDNKVPTTRTIAGVNLVDDITVSEMAQALVKKIGNYLYPIGSIYMTTDSTINPSSFFGGTWVSWGSGKVPVGVNPNDGDFNTAEKTGGAKTVNASHNHSIGITTLNSGASTDSTGGPSVTNTDPTTLTVNQIPEQ